MFNLGPAEVLFILAVALLVLGPQRLPELARGLGRFFFEFRRQTDEVRGLVEREFYRMDHTAPRVPAPAATAEPQILPASGGVVARGTEATPEVAVEGRAGVASPAPPESASPEGSSEHSP